MSASGSVLAKEVEAAAAAAAAGASAVAAGVAVKAFRQSRPRESIQLCREDFIE